MNIGIGVIIETSGKFGKTVLEWILSSNPNRYKYTYYVEIDVIDLEVVEGRDGVFVIPDESALDLIGCIVSAGTVGIN